MVITYEYLKEYARRIYNQEEGYTFEKVYSLFPRYGPIIMAYYNEIAMAQENERIAKAIRLMGLEISGRLRQISASITVIPEEYYYNFTDTPEWVPKNVREEFERNDKKRFLEGSLDNCEMWMKVAKKYADLSIEAYEYFGADVGNLIWSFASDATEHARKYYGPIKVGLKDADTEISSLAQVCQSKIVTIRAQIPNKIF